jgi:23S rRNA (cytosine1962-C5)-methyltransferase
MHESFIAESCESYQLIDSAEGRKLERIAGHLVERACSQAIWTHRRYNDSWKKIQSVAIRKKDGGGEWVHHRGDPSPLTFEWKSSQNIDYKFKIKFTSFGHCGIFFEQFPIWNFIEKKLTEYINPKKELRFLNLFAYTGGASVVAAVSGAKVVHVDSSKGILDWGRKNEELNPKSQGKIQWFQSDVMKFLEQAVKRKEIYDGILTDPPSWGHGAKKEKWEFDLHISKMLELCQKILAPKKSFLILTSHTQGVQAEALKNILAENFVSGSIEYGDLGVKHAQDDRVLPAGIFSILERP